MLIKPLHHDYGDMCNRTFAYYTLTASPNINDYDSAVSLLEPDSDGWYLRGVSPGWWYTFHTTSRDQLSIVTCAQIRIQDVNGARRLVRAWLRRAGFAQNIHSNYDLKQRLPDFITPTLLGNMIRAGRYSWLYWVLPILDLGYIWDVVELYWVYRWDAQVQSVPMVVAANLHCPTFVSQWALRCFRRCIPAIERRLTEYFAEPWANCLPEFPKMYVDALKQTDRKL